MFRVAVMSILFRQHYANLPNLITLFRILAIPAMILLMLAMNASDRAHHASNMFFSFMAALVFGVASFSDIIDGYLARRYNAVSVFGKFFDPLADKLLSLAALIMLIPLSRMPAWLVVFLLVREVSITMLRSVAANEQIIISASEWGKYKNAFLSVGISFIILHYAYFGIQWRLIGWVLFIMGALFSIGSGIHYVYGFYQEVKKRAVGEL